MTLVDELKHLEGIKGNFMLSETEYLSPITLFEKGKVASQIVYSNLAQIVEQQQYFLILFGARQYRLTFPMLYYYLMTNFPYIRPVDFDSVEILILVSFIYIYQLD